MILPLAHTKLIVYKVSNDIILECYKLVRMLPVDERFNLAQQIKRAAVSVKLNIAEGATRKSLIERKRFFEISRGSLVEVDACFEVCVDLQFLRIEQLNNVDQLIKQCYAMLSRMII